MKNAYIIVINNTTKSQYATYGGFLGVISPYPTIDIDCNVQ